MQVGTEQAAAHLKTLGMSTMVSAFLAICILYVYSYAACYLPQLLCVQRCCMHAVIAIIHHTFQCCSTENAEMAST